MKEYFYKDKILKLLSPDETGKLPAAMHSDNMENEIGITISQLIYLLDDLSEDNYISIKKTSGVSSYIGGRICNIEHKGIAFLNAGGFTKIAKKERRSINWTITKTIVFALNSLLILGVAFWGVRVQIEANSLNESNSKPITVETAKKASLSKVRDTLTVKKSGNK